MADRLSKEQRRKNMQAVKNKDSFIEVKLRKALWAKGLRYRKHYNKLPGKPDIVFPGKKVAVFCDSEFWHGKNWDKKKEEFKSNQDFWHSKIERNIERDKEVNKLLKEKGWTVVRFWGNEIKNDLENCVNKVITKLNNNG